MSNNITQFDITESMSEEAKAAVAEEKKRVIDKFTEAINGETPIVFITPKTVVMQGTEIDQISLISVLLEESGISEVMVKMIGIQLMIARRRGVFK